MSADKPPHTFKKKKKVDINELGEHYESHSFRLILRSANRLLKGFFLFKRRKGDITAGSATFFALMSFCPVLLMMISLTGTFVGDVPLAKRTVLESINSSFPHLAPWIMTSIEKIVDAQLSGGGKGMNVLNMMVLLYSSLGVIASVMFGIDVLSRTEPRGGFILEDAKALVSGAMAYTFMFVLILFSKQEFFFSFVSLSPGPLKDTIVFLMESQVLPAALSLGFFTFFYRWAPSTRVNIKDSFYGALTFVGFFMVGKSFYWVYLQYAKENLHSNYGNFYTLIVAVVWVYFLMSAFFMGASVAYLELKKDPALAEVDAPEVPPQDSGERIRKAS